MAAHVTVVSNLHFMLKRSQAVCFDGKYLHALSSDALDSYTSRVVSSVISRQKMAPAVLGKQHWASPVSTTTQ